MMFRRKRGPVPICWVCVPGTPVGPPCDPCNEWSVALVAHQSQSWPDPAKRPRRSDFGPINGVAEKP